MNELLSLGTAATATAHPGVATMGTAGFPAWPVRTEGVIAPDERLPWPQTFAMGAQHVVAMFGATVLAPLLMGFDPNVAVLMSGVGTLVFTHYVPPIPTGSSGDDWKALASEHFAGVVELGDDLHRVEILHTDESGA